MAKEDKKEKPAGWNFDPVEGFIVLIFLLALLGSLVPAIIRYVTSGELSFFGFRLSFIGDFFSANVQLFKTIGFLVGGGAALGTFILTKKGDAVWRLEKAKLYPTDMKVAATNGSMVENPTLKKWDQIIALSESINASDWRLAIIEADIILDDLLTNLRLPGETMGDKLKAVEQSDFNTIDLAWEAHKARNMIAHQGSDFLLNQHETRRIIALYEAVFKEFHLI
jgi:hypothetical protein